MARATKGQRAARERAEEPTEDRRADLVEAAYMLVAEKGLAALRTRDIAARAGVNISTLHYYFGTKDALLVAVVEHAREKFTSGASREALDRGEHTLRSHLEEAWKSFQVAPHLSIVLQELSLRGQRDATTRAAFRTLYAFWNAILEEVLEAGIARGEIRRDLDPRAGARVVTSYIIGAMVQLGVNAKAFDFTEVAEELERWVAKASR